MGFCQEGPSTTMGVAMARATCMVPVSSERTRSLRASRAASWGMEVRPASEVPPAWPAMAWIAAASAAVPM